MHMHFAVRNSETSFELRLFSQASYKNSWQN